jgi:hypothetical protein
MSHHTWTQRPFDKVVCLSVFCQMPGVVVFIKASVLWAQLSLEVALVAVSVSAVDHTTPSAQTGCHCHLCCVLIPGLKGPSGTRPESVMW